jgi:hypothetical protein
MVSATILWSKFIISPALSVAGLGGIWLPFSGSSTVRFCLSLRKTREGETGRENESVRNFIGRIERVK